MKNNYLSTRVINITRLSLAIATVCALGADCAWAPLGQQRQSVFAARRAADDSRPLMRVAANLLASDSQESPIVMGRFRAPAPERIHQQRVPKSSQFASQTIGASYQVAESEFEPDKIVHGLAGASTTNQAAHTQATRPDKQRTVGVKIQVSDEGLNYPPSKLSADIYGNMAEIVTAPPEAVDSDFLLPNSRRFSPNRP